MLFLGEHPGMDGGEMELIPSGALTRRLDFTPWAPLLLPLRGAGRAKQRKGLTRKEEALRLRTEGPGVSPPSPTLCQGQ